MANEVINIEMLTQYDTLIKQYIASQSGSNTTYTLTKSGSTITLTGSDGTTNDVTDSDTTALGSMTGTLGIGHGGTGATTAAGARENLNLGAATAIKTSSTSTPTSNTKAALNSINSTSTSLLALSSNGIQCKAAGKVIITGGYYVNGIGSGGAAILLYKNTTSQGEFVQNAQGAGTAAPVFPPRVIDVAAGDVIYLYWRTSSAVTCQASRVWLTVQYVS